jgi:hypothetical protein
MLRYVPIHERPECPHCGKPMQAFGVEEDPQPTYSCVNSNCRRPPTGGHEPNYGNTAR